MNDVLYTMFLLNTLKETPGKKDKEELIKTNKDNNLFVYILEFLCNNDKITGLAAKKLSKETKEKTKDNIYSTVKELIEYILANPTGSDKIISVVQESIKTFPEKTHEILKEIVTKSFKCGITSKTLNKAIPGTIEEFNLMLAESYEKNKKLLEKNDSNIIATVKLDGMRVALIKNKDNIIIKSRQGKTITGLIEIEKEAINLTDGVYDGELLAHGHFESAKDRYKETMKRASVLGEKTGLKMHCFDYLNNVTDFYNKINNTAFENRKSMLFDILTKAEEDTVISKYNNIKYLDNLYVGKDMKEIYNIFLAAVEFGEEGLMLNIADAPYEFKRTKNLLKYKVFKTGDVKVIGIEEGSGKYKGTLGAIHTEFTYNNITCKCKVGSGFTDNQREEYFNNPDLLINKIVEIQFFEVTSNEEGTYSLRFPVWLDIIREDKTETNID